MYKIPRTIPGITDAYNLGYYFKHKHAREIDDKVTFHLWNDFKKRDVSDKVTTKKINDAWIDIAIQGCASKFDSIDIVIRALGHNELENTNTDEPLDQLCYEIATSLDSVYARDVLRKKYPNEKLQNAGGPKNRKDTLIKSKPSFRKGKHTYSKIPKILIVDDVTTTASTAEIWAQTIKDTFPDCEIYLFALCQTCSVGLPPFGETEKSVMQCRERNKKLLDKFSKYFNLENQILGANLIDGLPSISEAEMDLFQQEEEASIHQIDNIIEAGRVISLFAKQADDYPAQDSFIGRGHDIVDWLRDFPKYPGSKGVIVDTFGSEKEFYSQVKEWDRSLKIIGTDISDLQPTPTTLKKHPLEFKKQEIKNIQKGFETRVGTQWTFFENSLMISEIYRLLIANQDISVVVPRKGYGRQLAWEHGHHNAPNIEDFIINPSSQYSLANSALGRKIEKSGQLIDIINLVAKMLSRRYEGVRLQLKRTVLRNINYREYKLHELVDVLEESLEEEILYFNQVH